MIFYIFLDNNIVLEFKWSTRDGIIQVDGLSKIFDLDNWGVSYIIIKYFICYGVHSLVIFLQTVEIRRYLGVFHLIPPMLAFEDIGIDKSKFGLHNLRSGDANNGVFDKSLWNAGTDL